MQHWATVLGAIAGLCSTTSFVPQLWKGWLIGSAPVVIFNLISLCLSATILLMKLRALH